MEKEYLEMVLESINGKLDQLLESQNALLKTLRNAGCKKEHDIQEIKDLRY